MFAGSYGSVNRSEEIGIGGVDGGGKEEGCKVLGVGLTGGVGAGVLEGRAGILSC